jgi:hypothetical protein
MKIKDYEIVEEELNELNLRERGALDISLSRHYGAENMKGRLNNLSELVKSGDAENWHTASMWLCASARYSMWDKKYDPRSVMKLLDDILIALNPTVLVAKTLDAGVIKRDAYDRFKPFKEE